MIDLMKFKDELEEIREMVHDQLPRYLIIDKCNEKIAGYQKEIDAFRDALKNVESRWIAEATERDVDAMMIIEKARKERRGFSSCVFRGSTLECPHWIAHQTAADGTRWRGQAGCRGIKI